MKEFVKTKVVTGLVVAATIILGGVAIFTAIRLYQLRQQSVALNAPESKPFANTLSPSPTSAPNLSCQQISFSISLSPTPTLPPDVTATPTPTTNPSATSSPTPLASASPSPTSATPPPTKPPSVPEPEDCPEPKPGAVTITSVAKNGTEATITWTKSDLATHYVIAYGTNPDNLIYGVPNTGNVTTYTVSSLNSGATYYFVVYAVNDCQPSDASNVKSSVAGTAAEIEQLPAAGLPAPTLYGIGFGTLILLLALVLAL